MVRDDEKASTIGMHETESAARNIAMDCSQRNCVTVNAHKRSQSR